VNHPLEDREMLILSRKANESIRIGNDIVVTVVELGRGRVRLGIEAPREVPVHREEIFHELSVREPSVDSDRCLPVPCHL